MPASSIIRSGVSCARTSEGSAARNTNISFRMFSILREGIVREVQEMCSMESYSATDDHRLGA